MDVLSPEIKLPKDLDSLTDPNLGTRRIVGMAELEDESLIVALTGEQDSTLFRVEGEDLCPVGDVKDISRVWTCEGDSVLVQSKGSIWRVDSKGRQHRLIDLPENLVSHDIFWNESGLVLSAFVDRQDSPKPGAPWFYPSKRSELVLCHYTSKGGWEDLAKVPEGSGRISISENGRRMVWRESVNVVPEEAQRGEFYGLDFADGEIRRLTENAGQAGHALMSSEGDSLLFTANYELDMPITTHLDLWWRPWDGSERRNLTGGGQCVVAFGWSQSGDQVWVSLVDGLELRTVMLGLDGNPGIGFGDQAASSDVIWLKSGKAAFEFESETQFPSVWTGERMLDLPGGGEDGDYQTCRTTWKASDGLAIEGVYHQLKGMSSEAPLLVKPHGGPAGSVLAVRSDAARYRYLLQAGYRVFNPAFRGSLGFGDAFAQGNIACQGEADLDDILTGIHHLKEIGISTSERVGIFGGSYGGYMTLRALAVTDRFQAGVAMYGFVDNRRMTLETGDFTYETEYIAPLSWPVSDETRKGDVFSRLDGIKAPLLLLHGEDDPVCPISESLVTCRALEALGVTVGMVAYPGEGHGFRKKKNRRDAARRMLGWFLTYLPHVE